MKKPTLHSKALVATRALTLLKKYVSLLEQEAKCFDCEWPLGLVATMKRDIQELEKELK